MLPLHRLIQLFNLELARGTVNAAIFHICMESFNNSVTDFTSLSANIEKTLTTSVYFYCTLKNFAIDLVKKQPHAGYALHQKSRFCSVFGEFQNDLAILRFECLRK